MLERGSKGCLDEGTKWKGLRVFEVFAENSLMPKCKNEMVHQDSVVADGMVADEVAGE